jgi:signal transduction histidine kinase
MSNLFVRLYIVLIIAFIGLGISIDAYIDQQESSNDLTSDIELHKGTFFLLNKELQSLPSNEREQYLQLIAPSFGFPIQLVALNNFSFTAEQNRYLNQGGIVSRYDDQLGKAWFFQKLANDSKIIVIGPILLAPNSSTNLITNTIFFLGLALIIFMWAWPLSKGLQKLTKAATAFGEGDFSARASTKTSAPLIALVKRFNAMASRIERLIKSHKELSHAVSHELRTPIARLRFAMEMVRELPDKNQQEKYLQTMDDNIEELDGLVDELLTYARFDREEPDLQIKQQDIVSLCHQVIEKFSLTHQHLAMYCTNPIDKPVICAFDEDAITRALDNLIRNACRYAQQKIEVSIHISDEQLILIVEDDGCGVPEAERHKLFDPFVRLDQSRDRNSGGIGLGLAMVKKLIELHHGKALVTSSPLGGARFQLTWPLHYL